MKNYLLAMMIVCICTILISGVSATLTPSTVNATLNPGQSISEHKTVFLPGTIPKGDVIFAFDCTGSMSDAINVAKTQAISIMTTLGTLITDVQFGVMSFMDYPHYYSSYDYSGTYGDSSWGDYAYRLDQPITSNTALVSNKINGLVIGNGFDMPQDYARIMYESYSDTSIGWRTGARHILVILGDSVPHYENLNEGISGNSSLPSWPGIYSTGGDPGRDEVMFTSDDIYLPTALQAMNTSQITLLYVKCHDQAYPDDTSNMMYWNYWTGITGGAAYGISDASKVPDALRALIEHAATHINKLTLKAQTGYETWLTSVIPPEYDNITIPPTGVNETFDIVITVPLSTVLGSYVFNITANADGASYGEQQVTINVEHHDVAVVDVVPDANWVYQGKLCHAGVNVTVANLGESTENFTVTLFAVNDTATPSNNTVGSQAVLNLPPNATLVLRFVWNSSSAQPCHWYNMTAVASTVPHEINTDNNVMSSSILVKVRLVGDVNGDGKVDITDVSLAATAFGTTSKHPRWLPWGPYADINNDGKIDLFDIAWIAKNFGKSCV